MDVWGPIAARLNSALGFIGDALRNPAADERATLLVLAVGALVVLIAVLSVAILVSSWRSRARFAAMQASVAEGSDTPEQQVPASSTAGAALGQPMTAARPRRSVRSLVTGLSATVIVLAVVWVVAGVSTGQSTACLSCHPGSPHSLNTKSDPHRAVACVVCHEAGGPVSEATLNLSPRITHYVEGGTGGAVPAYGAPASSDCLSCHADRIASVTTSRARGLRMSHAEPIAAGADCLDCHVPKDGLVLADTVGMQPCLRCHDDSKASAACDTCHTRDPASATVAIEPSSTAYAQRLIPQPSCDGCHSTAKCDACHGVPMPHSEAFKGAGHAREAAIELWNDNGRRCQKCHYKGRRECTNCHELPFLAHGPAFKEGHKSASWGGGCTCHDYRSPVRGRNFCVVCHATKPATAVE